MMYPMEGGSGGTRGVPDTSATVPEEGCPEAEQALERACASQIFQKAPVLRDLLLFLWRNRKNVLTEYVIGVDVLGRRPDFDPKNDATVRVHVSRLRQRLRDYYEAEGLHSKFRFSIPLGAHRIEYTEIEKSPKPEPLHSQMEEPQKPADPVRNYWRVMAVIALAVCLALGVDNWRMRSAQVHPAGPKLSPFWQTVVGARKSMNVILPAPQFFIWRQQHFVTRDFRVNQPDAISGSPVLELLRSRWGEPETTGLYTVTSDTLAAGEIAKHLQDRGISVDIMEKSDVPQSLLEERDAILLFKPETASQFEPLIHPLSFRMGSGTEITNLKPAPGEPAFWSGKQYSQELSLSNGIIAFIPSRNGAADQLIIVCQTSNILSRLLTNPSQLHNLEEFWRAHGSPGFFEMVIQFERKGKVTLNARPVAIHSWKDGRPFMN